MWNEGKRKPGSKIFFLNLFCNISSFSFQQSQCIQNFGRFWTFKWGFGDTKLQDASQTLKNLILWRISESGINGSPLTNDLLFSWKVYSVPFEVRKWQITFEIIIVSGLIINRSCHGEEKHVKSQKKIK